MNRIDKTLEESQSILGLPPIDEMVYVCKKKDGHGIVVEVRSSNEHGVPHAHVKNTEGTKACVIEITNSAPVNQDSVKVLAGNRDTDLKGEIVKWSKGVHRKSGLNNWLQLQVSWDSLRPD